MQNKFLTFLVTAAATLFCYQAAAATLDPEMEKAFDANPLQRVIVTLKNDLSGHASTNKALTIKEKIAKRDQQKAIYKAQKTDLFRALGTKGHKLKLIEDYDALPQLALDVTKEQALALLDSPQVEQVALDHPAQMAMMAAQEFVKADYFKKSYGLDGKNTAIVVMDTPLHYWDKNLFPGCSSDQNIANFEKDKSGCPIKRYVNKGSADLKTSITDKNGSTSTIQEYSDHGTYVSATINAVAPGTDIIHINIFSWNETKKELLATQTDQIKALNWVLDNIYEGDLAGYNVLAVNMSISGKRAGLPSSPCNSSNVFTPIIDLYENGILTFIAAGNDGFSNSIGEPGCISPAITVGAQYHIDNDYWKCNVHDDDSSQTYIHEGTRGDVTCFSNRNGMVDFIAPGVSLKYSDGKQENGTSFASPIAAASYLLYQQSFFKYDKQCVNGDLSYPGECFNQLFWADQQMKTQAWPVYSFNSYYSQINLEQELSPHWNMSYRLGENWFKEDEENRINKSYMLEYKAYPLVKDIPGKVGGLYLSINLLAPDPSKVTIKITAPDGTNTSFPLPKTATANFNGIIGRTILPGKLQSFNGLKVADNGKTCTSQSQCSGNQECVLPEDATQKMCITPWTVSFHNNSDDKINLLQASLIFVDEGCEANCSDLQCGDNLCGGKCGVECDDGIVCNGLETCRYGSCHKGQLDDPTCDDGDGLECTNYCEETTGKCGTTRRIVKNYCVVDNKCYKDGDHDPNNACKTCQASKYIQTEFTVDEDMNGQECEDGDLCTQGDKCNQGVCKSGRTVDCDDKNPCTEETCDPLMGCQYTNIEAPCDDHDACTLNEHCYEGQCTGADRIFCDDDNPCTTDSCDHETGRCIFANNTASCDDGNAATIGDQCRDGVCVPGAAKRGCSNTVNDPSDISGALFLLLSLLVLKKRKNA